MSSKLAQRSGRGEHTFRPTALIIAYSSKNTVEDMIIMFNT